MKEFGSEKIIFDKMTAVRNYIIFPSLGFCICIDGAFMGRSTLTTAFDGAIRYFAYNVDTLNICMKEFGSEKIIFDKMTAVRT